MNQLDCLTNIQNEIKYLLKQVFKPQNVFGMLTFYTKSLAYNVHAFWWKMQTSLNESV